MDVSLLISIFALLLSALAPTISSIIAGRFQLQEKKLEIKAEAERQRREFYDRHRAEVIERYITSVGRLCKRSSPDSFSEVGLSMGEVYLYLDSSYWPLLDAISQKTTHGNYRDPTPELIELCKKLSSDHIRAKNKINPNDSNDRKPPKISQES